MNQETVIVTSCVSSEVQTFSWTGTRWRVSPTLTSRSECVVQRWRWTAWRETTGSELLILTPNEWPRLSEGDEQCFVFCSYRRWGPTSWLILAEVWTPLWTSARCIFTLVAAVTHTVYCPWTQHTRAAAVSSLCYSTVLARKGKDLQPP